MTITVQCQQCGKSFGAKDEMAGRQVSCPSCNAPLLIPELELEVLDDLPADPALAAQQPTPQASRTRGPVTEEMRDLLKKFQSQAMALGVVWCVFGVFSIGLGAYLLNKFGGSLGNLGWPLVIGIIIAGVIWIPCGVMVCMKHPIPLLIATKVDYVMLFFSILGSLISLLAAGRVETLLAILALLGMINQAKRLVEWAKTLLAAGIPLNASPNDLR